MAICRPGSGAVSPVEGRDPSPFLMSTKDGIFLKGPRGKEAKKYNWNCPYCDAKDIMGRRLQCFKCNYKPSHSHIEKAKQREKVWLKEQEQKGERPERRQRQGGGDAGQANKGLKAMQARLDAQEKELKELRATAKESAGSQHSSRQLEDGNKGLEAHIARLESDLAFYTGVDDPDMVAILKTKLEKARKEKQLSKGTSQQQQTVLNKIKENDRKLESKAKRRTELLDSIKAAKEELDGVEEEMDTIRKLQVELRRQNKELAEQGADMSGHDLEKIKKALDQNGQWLEKTPDNIALLNDLGTAYEAFAAAHKAQEERAKLQERQVPSDHGGGAEGEGAEGADGKEEKGVPQPMQLEPEALKAIVDAVNADYDGEDKDAKRDAAINAAYSAAKRHKAEPRGSPYHQTLSG